MAPLRILRLPHYWPTRFSVFNLSRSTSPCFSSATVQETPSCVTIPAAQHTAATAPSISHARQAKKPLDIFFKEAVRLIKRAEESDYPDAFDTSEISEKSKKLRALERELKNLSLERSAKWKLQKTQKKRERNEASGESVSRLCSLFGEPSNSDGKGRELSPEMVSFVYRLYRGGYLNDESFLKDGRLDLSWLSRGYSFDNLRFAAEMFGQDHQELAERLSTSDLKKVALFGCPSLDKRTVIAAKNLRSFFHVQEYNVCELCKLKSLCKYSGKTVKQQFNFNLKDALRLLTEYGLDSVRPQLNLSDDIRFSISKLLKQAGRLGR